SSPGCSDVMDFEPGGQQPHRQTDEEIGKQRAKIRRADSFAFPPNKNGKHDRKRTGHTLGKEGTDKEEQGKNKPAITPRQVACFQVFKVEIGENAPQEKCGRKEIFDFGNPRDRFNHHWVHCENSGGEPGAPQPELSQHEPKQNCVQRVQRHIHRVIAERMKSPELILDPEGGAGDWIILLQGKEIGPEPIETVHSFKSAIVHQPRVVVPDEAIAERWQIGEDGNGHEKSCLRGGSQGCGNEFGHVALRHGLAQWMLGTSSGVWSARTRCNAIYRAEYPHPNLLPTGEGITSPLGEGWVRVFQRCSPGTSLVEEATTSP